MLDIKTNGFCSPSVPITNPTCFNDDDLSTIIHIYNSTHPDKIKSNVKHKYRAINNKLKHIVGNKKHWLWCDYLVTISKNYEYITQLKHISDTRLLPPQPKSWKLNKFEWLSNFDLEYLLRKYHNALKYKYHFIGVKDYNFALKDADGTCSIDQDCNINIQDIINKHKDFIGIIIYKNQHWRSLFIVINPKYKAYGTYYYDSVGTSMPSELQIYVDTVNSQLKSIYPNHKNPIFKTSKYRMQESSYACGLFQATFQIKFPEMLLKNPQCTFQDFAKLNPTDKNVWKYRDELYRESL
jgi:hypothetical protein